ncbi:uncharacterized protein LAJ45_00683 [Morchella importuna]|uniref:uncharacterized protein n=1 Tax=Morchella importuna TaxID=1174673 RepID=UPI001E8E7AC2|nr:uncharacterized protein LAJ45_00683 [Morchella importuna]KAH8155673.1 hypothetical protein LAJ45_00683 [Morchella importuna]
MVGKPLVRQLPTESDNDSPHDVPLEYCRYYEDLIHDSVVLTMPRLSTERYQDISRPPEQYAAKRLSRPTIAFQLKTFRSAYIYASF